LSTRTGTRAIQVPRSGGEWLQLCIGGIVVAVMCFPALWMTYSSFKTNREIFRTPFSLPETWHWENLTKAWTDGGLGASISTAS
jgi:ABC-type glycerol-3-phosphate transport system permease component